MLRYSVFWPAWLGSGCRPGDQKTSVQHTSQPHSNEQSKLSWISQQYSTSRVNTMLTALLNISGSFFRIPRSRSLRPRHPPRRSSRPPTRSSLKDIGQKIKPTANFSGPIRGNWSIDVGLTYRAASCPRSSAGSALWNGNARSKLLIPGNKHKI